MWLSIKIRLDSAKTNEAEWVTGGRAAEESGVRGREHLEGQAEARSMPEFLMFL